MKTSLLAAALIALSAPFLHAASDFFLKIDGIKGESSDAVHSETIEVSSWSWGASNPSTTSSGGGTGKVSMQDFHFVCSHDKSSPLLMLACAQGQHIPKATLYVRKQGSDPAGGPVEYLEITLEDILISSFSSQAPPPVPGGPHAEPTQSISLNFTKITYDYAPADGSASVKAGWDVVANKKI